MTGDVVGALERIGKQNPRDRALRTTRLVSWRVRRAFEWFKAAAHPEAVPDHVEDEPTWPTEVTPLER